jgi:hypothetical protein
MLARAGFSLTEIAQRTHRRKSSVRSRVTKIDDWARRDRNFDSGPLEAAACALKYRVGLRRRESPAHQEAVEG